MEESPGSIECVPFSRGLKDRTLFVTTSPRPPTWVRAVVGQRLVTRGASCYCRDLIGVR